MRDGVKQCANDGAHTQHTEKNLVQRDDPWEVTRDCSIEHPYGI